MSERRPGNTLLALSILAAGKQDAFDLQGLYDAVAARATRGDLTNEAAARDQGDRNLLDALNAGDARILKAAFDSDNGLLNEISASAARLVARAEATDAAVNTRFDVIETSTPNARPGDMPSAFTRFTIGGVPEFLPNIAALVAVGDNGRVLRISGPDERPIVMKRYQRIEPAGAIVLARSCGAGSTPPIRQTTPSAA